MPRVDRHAGPRYAWAVAVALAIGVFLANAAAPVSLAGGDTMWSVPLAYSVVHEHNVYLDEFPDLLRGTKVHTVVEPNGHRVFAFPWGPSIVSAPLIAAYDGWLHLHHSSLRAYLHVQFGPTATTYPDAHLEIRLASFYAAATTALLFLLLLRRTKRRGLSLFLSLMFAFGTSMFSTVSRALWSHTPSVFLLVVALYLFQAFEDKASWRDPRLTRAGGWVAFACGFALGTAYFVRPTNAVPLAVLVLAFFLRRPRAGFAAAAGAAIPLIAMVGIDLAAIGHPLQPYYQLSRARPGSTYFVGLAGDLVSPARGLFIWSPFVLLGIPAAIVAARHPSRDRVLTVCLAVAVLHWLSIATLRPWWAGWSIGPRLFSDVLPFLMLLVADGLLRLRSLTPRHLIRPSYAIVAVVFAFSLFTNVRAGTRFSVQLWNASPQNIDTHSNRAWDWSDLQFLR